jgi:hypothetical protein
MIRIRNGFKILIDKPPRDHFGYLDIGGKIISKLILEKHGARVWTGYRCLGLESSCRNWNEPSGFVKVGTFLDHISNYQVFKETIYFGVKYDY